MYLDCTYILKIPECNYNCY